MQHDGKIRGKWTKSDKLRRERNQEGKGKVRKKRQKSGRFFPGFFHAAPADSVLRAGLQIYRGDPRNCAIFIPYGAQILGFRVFSRIKIIVVHQVRMSPAEHEDKHA